jgi:hypothetical protein
MSEDHRNASSTGKERRSRTLPTTSATRTQYDIQKNLKYTRSRNGETPCFSLGLYFFSKKKHWGERLKGERGRDTENEGPRECDSQQVLRIPGHRRADLTEQTWMWTILMYLSFIGHIPNLLVVFPEISYLYFWESRIQRGVFPVRDPD